MSAAPTHATAVALFCPDGWRCTLLRGPSGSGKSDLALRLLAQGWRLVGDDYVHLFASANSLYAAPVPSIAGRIEARGLGLLTVGQRPATRLRLVVDCVQAATERLPEPEVAEIAGVSVPRLSLDVRPASASIILTEAMRRL